MTFNIALNGGDLRQGTFLGTTNSENAPAADTGVLSHGLMRSDYLIANGSRTWYNSPEAIRVESFGGDDVTITSGISSGGLVTLAKVDNDTGAVERVELTSGQMGLEADDHCDVALYHRSDGKLLICGSKHGADNFLHWNISTNANDISAWPTENTRAGSGGSQSGYSCLVNLPDYDGAGSDRLFWFYRQLNDRWYALYSDDEGDNWSDFGSGAARSLFEPASGKRAYPRFSANGTDRIDITWSQTQNSPAEAKHVWHCYIEYDGTNWRAYNSGGTALNGGSNIVGTNTPFDITTDGLTLVYDSDAGGNFDALGMSIASHSGNPEIVFYEMEDVNETHNYWWARWNGSSWVLSEILANAGGRIVDDGVGQPRYTAGLCLDPANPGVVWLIAGEKRSADSRFMQHEVRKYTTSSLTTPSWSYKVYDPMGVFKARPVVPLNQNSIANGAHPTVPVTYQRGWYEHWDSTSVINYNTQIACWPLSMEGFGGISVAILTDENPNTVKNHVGGPQFLENGTLTTSSVGPLGETTAIDFVAGSAEDYTYQSSGAGDPNDWPQPRLDEAIASEFIVVQLYGDNAVGVNNHFWGNQVSSQGSFLRLNGAGNSNVMLFVGDQSVSSTEVAITSLTDNHHQKWITVAGAFNNTSAEGRVAVEGGGYASGAYNTSPAFGATQDDYVLGARGDSELSALVFDGKIAAYYRMVGEPTQAQLEAISNMLNAGRWTSALLTVDTASGDDPTLTYTASVPANTTITAQLRVNGGSWSSAQSLSTGTGNTAKFLDVSALSVNDEIELRINFTSTDKQAYATVQDMTIAGTSTGGGGGSGFTTYEVSTDAARYRANKFVGGIAGRNYGIAQTSEIRVPAIYPGEGQATPDHFAASGSSTTTGGGFYKNNSVYDAAANRTIYAWLGRRAYFTVKHYDHSTKSWGPEVILTTETGVHNGPLDADNHIRPTVCGPDSQGYIHGFFGSHAEEQGYLKFRWNEAANTYDVIEDPTNEYVATGTGAHWDGLDWRSTYPHPFLVGDTLYVLFRREKDPTRAVQESISLIKRDLPTGAGTEGVANQWGTIVDLVDYGSTDDDRVYRSDCRQEGTTGRYHITWSFRNSVADSDFENVYHGILDTDNSDNFHEIGAAVTTDRAPVDKATANSTFRIFDTSGNATHESRPVELIFDSADNPWILFLYYDGVDATTIDKPWKLMLTWHDGTSWQPEQEVYNDARAHGGAAAFWNSNSEVEIYLIDDNATGTVYGNFAGDLRKIVWDPDAETASGSRSPSATSNAQLRASRVAGAHTYGYSWPHIIPNHPSTGPRIFFSEWYATGTPPPAAEWEHVLMRLYTLDENDNYIEGEPWGAYGGDVALAGQSTGAQYQTLGGEVSLSTTVSVSGGTATGVLGGNALNFDGTSDLVQLNQNQLNFYPEQVFGDHPGTIIIIFKGDDNSIEAPLLTLGSSAVADSDMKIRVGFDAGGSPDGRMFFSTYDGAWHSVLSGNHVWAAGTYYVGLWSWDGVSALGMARGDKSVAETTSGSLTPLDFPANDSDPIDVGKRERGSTDAWFNGKIAHLFFRPQQAQGLAAAQALNAALSSGYVEYEYVADGASGSPQITTSGVNIPAGATLSCRITTSGGGDETKPLTGDFTNESFDTIAAVGLGETITVRWIGTVATPETAAATLNSFSLIGPAVGGGVGPASNDNRPARPALIGRVGRLGALI